MSKLIRLTKTIKDFGILIDESEMSKFVNTESPYFKSLYYYPDDALEHFKSKNNSIKGYKGSVFTNIVTFDIDSKDLEVSRDNTIRLIQYLEQQGLFDSYSSKIAFSGSKGFHVQINTDHKFIPSELKSMCMYIAKQIKFNNTAGFKIDPQVYNINRIFRIANTPHEKTGLFKVEMLSQDLLNFSMTDILEASKSPQETYPFESSISEESIQQVLAHLPKVIAKVKHTTPYVIDTTIDRPCISALQNGDMNDGESNAGLLRLANYYRKIGLDKDQTRTKLIEAGDNREKLHPRTNLITLEKINQEILYPIFTGEGYTFTCNDYMLIDKCGGNCKLKCKTKAQVLPPKQETTINKLNIPIVRAQFRNGAPKLGDKPDMLGFKDLSETAKGFDEFARDSKMFRVESGIKELDDKVRILPNGLTIINAKAGVGKTSLMMNMAMNVSAKGQRGLIYQMDMAEDEFYTKLSSKELKLSPDDVLDLFYTDDTNFDDLKAEGRAKVAESMKNMMINYESDLSVEKIESDLIALINSDRKPSVIFIDYLQKIRGAEDYSKATEVLKKLKSLISKYKVCIVALSQVPRGQGNEETPLFQAGVAQGGAIYEQNASICINLWRPMKFAGKDEDKVMGYAVSKNRMGECFSGNLYFEGATSELRDMNEMERIGAEVAMIAYADIKAKRDKPRGSFRS